MNGLRSLQVRWNELFALLVVFVLLTTSPGLPIAQAGVSAQGELPEITGVDLWPTLCPSEGCILSLTVYAANADTVTAGGLEMTESEPGVWTTPRFMSQVNNDPKDMSGHYDIVATNGTGSVDADSPSVRVVAPGTEGTLYFAGEIPTVGNHSTHVASGIDENGVPMLATADADNNRVYVYSLNDNWTTPEEYVADSAVTFVGLTDMTGDNCPDLVVGAKYNGVTIYQGCRSGATMRFSDPLPRFGPATDAAAISDINRDGRPDVAVVSGDNLLWTYMNNGNGRVFTLEQWMNTGIDQTLYYNRIAASDNLVVARDRFAGRLVAYRRIGPENVQVTQLEANHVDDMVVADINQDGLPDVAALVDRGGQIAYWLQQADGSFTRSAVPGYGNYFSITVTHLGEVNAVVAAGADALYAFSWNGNGLGDPAVLVSGQYPGSCTWGYVNIDQYRDVVCGLNGSQEPDGAPIMMWLQKPVGDPVRLQKAPLKGVPDAGAIGEVWVVPGAPEITRTVTMTNVGAADMPWTALSSDFITVTPHEGMLAVGDTVELTLHVYVPSAVPFQTYQSRLIINNGDRPYFFPVALDINSVPKYRVEILPSAVEKTVKPGESAVEQMVFKNTGRQAIGWYTPTADVTWIRLQSEMIMDLMPGSQTVVDATLDATALSEGAYDGTVTVAQPGKSDLVVDVNLTVTDAMALEFGPAAVDLSGGGDLSQVMTLENPNPDTAVDWTIASDAAWLRFDKGKGTLQAGATATVTVTAGTGPLNIGTYSTNIRFTSAGKTMFIPVTLRVTEKLLYCPVITR